MRRMFVPVMLTALFMLWGCGEHIPVDNDEPPPARPDFGEEQFFQGPFYYDADGIQRFLLQSNRLISVQFDSTVSNTLLRAVAVNYNLRLFPDLTRPADVDWDTEKRRTSLWVVPEGSDISAYYTVFPRTADDAALFGLHPLVKKSFPSYVDQDLVARYFIDDRFFAFTSPEITETDLEDWNNFNGVEIVDSRTIGNTVEYLMHITGNSRFPTIESANEYHKSMFFLSAMPDFIVVDMND